MNESKVVVRIAGDVFAATPVVTYDDYKAKIYQLAAEADKARRVLLKIREIAQSNDASTDFGTIYNIARDVLEGL
jgi:hypothetical protein